MVGGWGWGVTVTRTKARSCATSCRMFFVSFFFLSFFLSFSSCTINYMYVSPTAVTTRGPAVAGGADADGRGSGGTFQMCSCGITAVSGCCDGSARVANHCLDRGCGVWVGELLAVTTTKATSCATSSRMLFVSFLPPSIESYICHPPQSPPVGPL